MNEPYFRNTTCSSMSGSISDQPQDWRSTTSQRAASIRKNLPRETMKTLVMPASAEVCTTKVQFSANHPTGTVLWVTRRRLPATNPAME